MIDNDIIGTGHWIFAAIALTGFIVFLFWSYRKDLPVHKINYRGSSYFLLVLLVIFFIIFIFKRLL